MQNWRGLPGEEGKKPPGRVPAAGQTVVNRSQAVKGCGQVMRMLVPLLRTDFI